VTTRLQQPTHLSGSFTPGSIEGQQPWGFSVGQAHCQPFKMAKAAI